MNKIIETNLKKVDWITFIYFSIKKKTDLIPQVACKIKKKSIHKLNNVKKNLRIEIEVKYSFPFLVNPGIS